MILAAFPPNSKVYFFQEPANAFMIYLPTSVLPVKAIFCISPCLTIACPVFSAPVTIFTTPGGKSASWIISANFIAVSGVVSAGFKTTVFPVAKAGAIFHADISKGKFQGIICPTTPIGFTSLPGKAYSNLSAHPA